MVSQPAAETKTDCEYSLDGLRRLAGFQQVQYMSSRVTRHVSNLGMSLDDVCNLLKVLHPSNFHCSERYQNNPRWHDVYLLPHPVPLNPQERLYIKFRVNRDCVLVELCSFHPEGWI